MSSDKVIPYLLVEKDIELANGKKIRIVKTKKEIIFQSFKDAESDGSKIALEIAENPILLQFMFLKSEHEYSFFGGGGTSLGFSLILNPSYNFGERMKRADYQDQMKKLEEKNSRSQDEMLEMYRTYMQETMANFSTDNKVSRIMMERNPSYKKLHEAIQESLKENPEYARSYTKQIQGMSKYAYEAQTLGKLKKYIEKIKDAERNAASISGNNLTLPKDVQLISTALNKLSKHVNFTIESLCFDCWFERNLIPFVAKVMNTKGISILEQCQQCKGNNLVQKIEMGMPKVLNSLLLLESSWFYEIVIGFAVSKLDFIKNVYIHKKIQAFDNGNVKKGVEADVIIITNDGKLFIIEVTKQGDTSNIMKTISQKIDNFKDAKIPYEKIMYFTADEQSKYWDIPKNTRVFTIHHLPYLHDFVKEWVS